MIILMQGAPGSGKTTYAEALKRAFGPQMKIVSTDKYFMVDGVYKFDPTKLALHHELCQLWAEKLIGEKSVVVVDNCNIRAEHAKPYLAIPGRGLSVTIKMTGQWESVHNVPPETVSRMRESVEYLGTDWVINTGRNLFESPNVVGHILREFWVDFGG